ncbi:MAG: DEAD/DEAH box helicase [Actinomycetaceae bacterium]|nr:DEAD/DEAH box helicase [Actinomycetaceae bacterium]
MTDLTFADLQLPENVLSAVEKMGFNSPTPIQAEAIPALLEGRDVVGVAQTGTGKTAAFALPLLTYIDPNLKQVQALILAPTRELALQSSKAVEAFAASVQAVNVVTVYGGASYLPQLKALKDGAQVVVGTPGRVIDLIEKGKLDCTAVRVFVLDEADEMLRMGFAEDVDTIAASVPAPGERITALFSATMPAAIEAVAQKHLVDPVHISVAPPATVADTLEQTYAVVPFKYKLEALWRVLVARSEDAAIVFVRTRIDAEEVAADMTRRGLKAAAISGDVSQAERERIVTRLREGSLDVLVATDVAARGLDVERIGLVINFDVPREAEAYVHRVGRTGRAGRQGRALTFFTPREEPRLKVIEKLTGTEMEAALIPTLGQVRLLRAKRLLSGLHERREQLIETDTTDFADLVESFSFSLDLSPLEVAAGLLADLTGALEPASDTRRGGGKVRWEEEVDEDGNFVSAVFEVGRGAKKARSRGGARPTSSGFPVRYRIEVGKKDGVKPAAIVGAITGEGGVNGSDLGRIEIYPTFSLVEMSGHLSQDAANKIGRATIAGRRLRIREDTGPKNTGSKGGSRSENKRNANRHKRRDLASAKSAKRSFHDRRHQR